MSLTSRFQNYLHEELGVAKDDSFLLAVSGGRDSMLMAHLFVNLGYNCVLAHCNFRLRGDESDADEQLVRNYGKERGLRCFVKTFETEAYAQEHGISIQMAARELRYEWFRTLKAEQGLTWICIAQHLNDHIETVFVNLTRGTGLAGMQGILPKRNDLLRPLLFLKADEVFDFVLKNMIPFRDDMSNFSTKYARNKVRLEIVPKFKEITPDFEQVMEENIRHFQEAYELLQSFITPIREVVFVPYERGYRIDKAKLQAYTGNLGLLYELFKPFGFVKEVLQDMLQNWDAEVGKLYDAGQYSLLMDRDCFFLERQTAELAETYRLIDPEDEAWTFAGYDFTLSISDSLIIERQQDRAQFDYDKLVFPLRLRFWQEGDYFQPLGMAGKKKLSDFFIDQKVDRFTKDRVPLLVNGNGEIIWVVNYRLDNRYKMTESTKKVVTLVCK